MKTVVCENKMMDDSSEGNTKFSDQQAAFLSIQGIVKAILLKNSSSYGTMGSAVLLQYQDQKLNLE